MESMLDDIVLILGRYFVKSLTKEDNSKMVEATEVCNLLMGMFQKVEYVA